MKLRSQGPLEETEARGLYFSRKRIVANMRNESRHEGKKEMDETPNRLPDLFPSININTMDTTQESYMNHEHSLDVQNDHHLCMKNHHDHDRSPFMRNEHPIRSMNPFMHSQKLLGDIEQAGYKTISPQGNHEANQHKSRSISSMVILGHPTTTSYKKVTKRKQ